MIVGSLASNFHGIPRSTRDADFVVQLAPDRPFTARAGARFGPHDRERFSRRQAATVLTHAAFVASPEDMIVTKLRWAAGAHRAKDRDDIRNIIAVQGPRLDWSYLDRWSAAHGTTALLAEIRASVPNT